MVLLDEVEFVVFVASVDMDSKEAMNKPNTACLGEKYIFQNDFFGVAVRFLQLSYGVYPLSLSSELRDI